MLLMAFNRPEKTARVIQALAFNKPARIIFNVDGPRKGHPTDRAAVEKVRECVNLITWKCDLEERFNDENRGLRRAIVDAVTFTTDRFGKAIIIEDDTIPGPHLLPYLNHMLSILESRADIGHISGYNVAAPDNIRNPNGHSRLSMYPESFAWATWNRAWTTYDDTLEWGVNCPIAELAKVTGGLVSAMRWRINFLDASHGRIDSWAYRWIASLWSNGLRTVCPNVNLASYAGFEVGTHARRKARWVDLDVRDPGSLDGPIDLSSIDEVADSWIGRTVFRETVPGLIDGLATSAALEVLRRRRIRKMS